MLTHTTERQELYRIIDTLPDDGVAAALELIRELRQSNDGYLPHIPNAETAAAIREGRAGNREKVTIDQIMAELNAGRRDFDFAPPRLSF